MCITTLCQTPSKRQTRPFVRLSVGLLWRVHSVGNEAPGRVIIICYAVCECRRHVVYNVHCESKKQDTLLMSITSRKID